MGRKAAYLKDVLLCVVLGLPAWWAGLTHTLADRYTWPEVIAGLAAIGVAVALARPRPLVAMLVTAALWAGSVAVRGDPTVFFLALAVMSYLAGVRMARARPALLGLSAAAVAAAAVVPSVRWLLAGRWDPGAWFFAVTGIALFGLVPWLAGHARHQSLALTRAGWERAGHLERERRMLAEQARQRERAAIAREMHDLLGHDLSLVALRIGALEVAAGLPESERRAAGEARAAVTAAAERLRDVVAVLGDGPEHGGTDHGNPEHGGPEHGGPEHGGPEHGDPEHEDTPSSPGESVDELVRRAAAAGMAVTLHGAQAEAGIPAPALATVRRVVREGLTNAAKHAPGAPVTVTVTVRLAHAPGETVVTVANAAPHRPGGGVTGGHGLRALAERVRLQGGSLRSGPADGGFALTVRLPHTVPPRVPPPGGPSTASRPVELDLALARGRVRRTRLAAALVCLAAAGGVAAFVLGFTVYEAATSVLPPAEFAKLRVGQAESEVAAVLPARTRIDDPSWPEPPIPPGARCRYYSTSPEPFGELELYRLCFAEGRLVAKAFLPS
ncbi:Signal transduction histidine kinase [Microbispora rosea]|uniref:histidine kinase n=1 Tax=Microbispora rosea TaxID=58117 RepID=A0A1N7HGE6_9ACTN|nr:sensor histidine kinase [Microbispora rosea]GIH50177.1 histidine kinase [Microbispora rosea subsp. rosea]SIS23966.1 Signal transduction histidine kinase [Microbispora rosea]